MKAPLLLPDQKQKPQSSKPINSCGACHKRLLVCLAAGIEQPCQLSHRNL
jgi:hypothetical protein